MLVVVAGDEMFGRRQNEIDYIDIYISKVGHGRLEPALRQCGGINSPKQ